MNTETARAVYAANKTFERCIERKQEGADFSIRCKLGLWAVMAQDKAAVEREARRYWMQYFHDGEYKTFLA